MSGSTYIRFTSAVDPSRSRLRKSTSSLVNRGGSLNLTFLLPTAFMARNLGGTR